MQKKMKRRSEHVKQENCSISKKKIIQKCMQRSATIKKIVTPTGNSLI